MCGINFIWDKKKQLASCTSIQAMNQAIRHRGQEASQILRIEWHNSQCFLGHNRLKIIDLDNRANQPFVSPCKNFALIFNGEIYNHQALKKELSPQITLQTHADTEVLLYYLMTFGKKKLHRLEGMFAFVFVDIAQQTFFYARDRFGIKPLYKFENENFLILSSEIRGILASQLVEKKLNSMQIFEYLTYKFAQFPHTFFKHIHEVETLPFIENQHNSAEKKNTFTQKILIEQTEKKILQSLQAQLQADVPVGLMLSGGIDSTLLLALCQRLGYEKIPAFTLTSQFNGLPTEDSYFAKLAVKQYNAQWYEVKIENHELTNLPEWVTLLDQPIADSAAWLTFLVCQQAHQRGYKVLLSGAGADELFAGYHRHKAFAQILKYPYLIFFLRFISPIFTFILREKSLLLGKKTRLWKKFFTLITKMHKPDFRVLTQIYTSNFNPNQLIFQNFNFKEALHYDLTHFLRQDVLKITDLMSMQNSVEVRVPYLDNALHSFLQTIPERIWLNKPKKWLLKAILQKYDGIKYVTRSKEGFGFPLNEWFRAKEGKKWLTWLQNEKLILHEWVTTSQILPYIQAHQQYQADYSAELWAILVLSIWLEQHFGILQD
ncbi:MAG: asparagine synthase (glutamine-hydrolyzing) [Microscillaceae bacterium]|nr:asparagine synthase (glutamine-hydrolyzing) [Microscillaceae bacterium]MDW8459800.1 asparagine synthase (glutamine-hydrolyzing) [Cytophagales bacterium]